MLGVGFFYVLFAHKQVLKSLVGLGTEMVSSGTDICCGHGSRAHLKKIIRLSIHVVMRPRRVVKHLTLLER